MIAVNDSCQISICSSIIVQIRHVDTLDTFFRVSGCSPAFKATFPQDLISTKIFKFQVSFLKFEIALKNF